MRIIEEEIFKVRKVNTEKKEYIITIGEHLATEKRFENKEDAENYIKEPHWDLIVSLVCEINKK